MLSLFPTRPRQPAEPLLPFCQEAKRLHGRRLSYGEYERLCWGVALHLRTSWDPDNTVKVTLKQAGAVDGCPFCQREEPLY